MEFKEVLEARYSCRAFLPEAVSDEVIRELVAASQRIPTWGNTQPGKVYAVSGAKAHALRIDLTAAATAGQDENPDIPMPQGFEGRLMDRYRALGKSLFKVLGIGRDDREKRREHYINNFNAFGAPTLVYFTVPDRQSPYVIMDVGAMVSTFCLAAADQGLGTCVIAALARYPDAVRTRLAIPDDEKIVIGVALGHPDPAAEVNRFRSAREELDEVLRVLS